MLANLYSGHVYIWNHLDQSLVKSFEVTDLPVRTSKFVARKQWVVTGSDDMYIRAFNYNTMDKVKSFEAHTDYIRNLAVHPTAPYLLSCSDDMLIKLWDWEKGWQCTQIPPRAPLTPCFSPSGQHSSQSTWTQSDAAAERRARGPRPDGREEPSGRGAGAAAEAARVPGGPG